MQTSGQKPLNWYRVQRAKAGTMSSAILQAIWVILVRRLSAKKYPFARWLPVFRRAKATLSTLPYSIERLSHTKS